MSEPGEFGPPVPDHEDAYRAVLYPWQWALAEDRPSSAAFDEEVFSVDIASRTTPAATIARFREVFRLVLFNCGAARSIGFDTRDEPDPEHPDNTAHAHVRFVDYHRLADKQRKKQARRLAQMCATIPTPATADE